MSNDTLNQPLPQGGAPNLNPIAVRFGFIAGFIGVLTSLVLYFTNQEYNTLLSLLPILFVFIIIIIAQQQVVKANNNYKFQFGILFNIGMKIAIIAALFTLFYYILYCNSLEPNFIDKMSEMTREKLSKKNMSEEQIEATLIISNKFTTSITVPVFKFLFTLIIGLLGSLIGAAIFKNEK
ncbi:MAG: DUF4199 domain-containing protein [Chitinophagales bacterium]